MQTPGNEEMDDDKTDVTVFDQVDVDELVRQAEQPIPILASLSRVADFEPFKILKRKIDIGRSEQSDICINRPNVSRKHATIYFENFGQNAAPHCVLEDRNSRNGTFVNRKLLKGHHILKDGDAILIGDCVIGFFLKTEAQVALEKNLKDALARHGHKTDLQRIACDFPATLDVMIPEETFTPKGVNGIIKDINMNGLRFVTQSVSKNFWQQLLKDKRHIQCRITLRDGEELYLSGKLAWIHYDNRVVPESCAMGVEFHELGEREAELLEAKISTLDRA